MEAMPTALLLDDGELAPVESLLQELGCDYVRARGGSLDAEIPQASELILATARRAMAHLEPPPPECLRPVRIAFVNEDSTVLRTQLRLLGFEYLIRHPLHMGALRLLLLRVLHRGPERRRSTRVPLRCEVTLQTAKRHETLILTEISRHGCCLLSEREEPMGMHIELTLSASVTAGHALVLSGRVARLDRDSQEAAFGIAVEFDALVADRTEQLEALLQRSKRAYLASQKPQDSDDEPEFERRSSTRRFFGKEILGHIDEAERTLIGKDLSLGGIRVEARPELTPERALRIALFGPEPDAVLTLPAHVLRNDGARGVVIRFDPMSPEMRCKLESMIIDMPAIEALQDGESDALGTVLTEILPPE